MKYHIYTHNIIHVTVDCCSIVIKQQYSSIKTNASEVGRLSKRRNYNEFERLEAFQTFYKFKAFETFKASKRHLRYLRSTNN